MPGRRASPAWWCRFCVLVHLLCSLRTWAWPLLQEVRQAMQHGCLHLTHIQVRNATKFR